MVRSSKCKIVVVDKKGKYSFLFDGFRKHKYSVSKFETIVNYTFEELIGYNVFFVVLYEMKDVFEVLKLNVGAIPIIVASENIKIIKRLRVLGFIPLIDLSRKDKVHINLHDCLSRILKD